MDGIRLDGCLVRTKLLLGIAGTESDELLKLIIADAEDMILGYCRISVLPRPLESHVPVIAADVFRETGAGKSEAPSDISQITEGARSVAYSVVRTDEGGVFERYRRRLMPYRRARTPSDVTEEFHNGSV